MPRKNNEDGTANVNTWASAILDMATNPKKRQEMGQSAREMVFNEYSLDKMIQRYESMYGELVD